MHARKSRAAKRVPRFDSEDQERDFWSTHDSSEYVDWEKAKPTSLPELKPSTTTISLRLPEALLQDLKVLANKRDVPYQSLLKIFLAERIERELRGVPGGGMPPGDAVHPTRPRRQPSAKPSPPRRRS